MEKPQRLRFSADQLGQIVEDMNTHTTQELADKHAGGSIRRIYYAFERVGINAFNRESALSATQLAQMIGHNRRTVSLFLAEGRINGITANKVGNYWRINWDGVTPITVTPPEFIPPTIHKEDPDLPLNKADGACSCCGNELERDQRFWCSSGCYREYQRVLLTEKRSGKESHWRLYPPHLRPPFQDWLKDKGFINRLPWARDDRFAYRFAQGVKVFDREKDIRKAIALNHGLLIDLEILGFFVDEIVGGLTANSGPVTQSQVEITLDKFKQPLPVTIASAGEFGSGVVSSITKLERIFLRQLYQKEEAYESFNDLKRNITRVTKNEVGVDIARIAGSLEPRLRDMGYRIDHRDSYPHKSGKDFIALVMA